METIPLVTQIAAALSAMAVCQIAQKLINNFRYIWTVELGNKWLNFKTLRRV